MYPIYIPSRGRALTAKTPKLLMQHKIPFKLVVEKKDADNYAAVYNTTRLLVLPGSDYGCVTFARNFIKEHARENGWPKHWQMDDDIPKIYEHKAGKVVSIDVKNILDSVEAFADSFQNIGIVGLTSGNFLKSKTKPYQLNTFAYTCVLISDNKLQWADMCEEDLDYNLKVLYNGLCTVRFDKYAFTFSSTGKHPGGYTDLNANGKRRVRMERTLRMWPEIPGIVGKQSGEGERLNTNGLWRKFKQQLVPAQIIF